jgi:putative transposase
MPNYRRLRPPGATYFFTLALQDRGSDLLISHIHDLRAAYAATIRDMPVRCEAIVVLPDHLHAVWTLPLGDSAYSERWRKIKARFSRAVDRAHRPLHLPASKVSKRECGIWQRRFWEHVIRDDADYRRHVSVCWGNPVRHGLVPRPADWPHSSIHREIGKGLVPPDWTGGQQDGRFGE